MGLDSFGFHFQPCRDVAAEEKQQSCPRCLTAFLLSYVETVKNSLHLIGGFSPTFIFEITQQLLRNMRATFLCTNRFGHLWKSTYICLVYFNLLLNQNCHSSHTKKVQWWLFLSDDKNWGKFVRLAWCWAWNKMLPNLSPLECFVIPAARSCSSVSGLLFSWLLLDKPPPLLLKMFCCGRDRTPSIIEIQASFPMYAKSWLPF